MIPGLVIETQIHGVLRRIIRATDLHSRRLVETVGLTGPQLVTLEAAAHLGPISTTTLARSVYLSPATLTGILDRLERRGLLERFRDTRDRRSWLVSVTDAGRRLLEVAPSPLQGQFREKLAGLEDWEQSQILSSLQRIASMMETDQVEASSFETSAMAVAPDQIRDSHVSGMTVDEPIADSPRYSSRSSPSPPHTVSSMEFTAPSPMDAALSPGALTQPAPAISADADVLE